MINIPYIPEIDNAYGRCRTAKKGLDTGERLKKMYREFYDNGTTSQEWDVVGEENHESGKVTFFLCAPNFITRVTLNKTQIKKHIFLRATTQPEYTIEQYRYCRLDHGWDGIGRYWGKTTVGEPYIDQISKMVSK